MVREDRYWITFTKGWAVVMEELIELYIGRQESLVNDMLNE